MTLSQVVRGFVSQVQTILPSIRNRLWNLRLGFHPIYHWFEPYTAGFNVCPAGCVCKSGRTYCATKVKKPERAEEEDEGNLKGTLRSHLFTSLG